MPYVNTKKMLLAARENGFAVGAFNVDNMEMVQAVAAAAEELDAPAIIQTSVSSSKYATMAMFSAMVKCVANASSSPIALLVDHGPTFETVFEAMANGYSTVMIDGSKLPIEENIELTKKVTQLASRINVTVEAELGVLGGKEETLDGGSGSAYTDPAQAEYFVKSTGVDSLAVAIGSAHGIYKTKPKLDIERIARIKELVSVPLVLHGASGISDEDLVKCVSAGMCKVNFATEMRQAFSGECVKYINADQEVIDPKKYTALARKAVSERAMEKMRVLGCAGKAKLCL